VSGTAVAGTLKTGFERSRPIERVCYLVGAALVVSGLVHLGVFAVRGGPWQGPVSWRKPTTFGLSFGVSLISVAWVSSYLRLSERTRDWLLGIFAADCVVEVAGITMQAWRHLPSHLNTETPSSATIAAMLAVGGFVLIAVLGTMAAVAIRGGVEAAPSMRLAIQAGFALLLVGLASGAAMIARGEVLIRQGDRQVAYDHAGFLKALHGITLHAVLVLPALAWLLARTNRSESARTRAVTVAIGCYLLAAGIALVVSLIRM
jgi:hypothetical protein